MFWDGNCKKSYSTTEKESADFIQFAYSATGRRATIYTNNRVGSSYKTGGKNYIRKSIEYSVNISDNTTVGMRSNHNKCDILRIKSKDGKRYCFTVPSGMLVLRRNNRIFITGNSGKSTLLINFISKGISSDKNSNKNTKNKVYFYIYNYEESQFCLYYISKILLY